MSGGAGSSSNGPTVRRTTFKDWAEAFSAYRAPLIVAVLAAFLLSSVDQVLDLYRLHLETDAARVRGALAVASIVALCLGLLAVSDVVRGDGSGARNTALDFLPALIGALPFAGIALGLYFVANPETLEAFGAESYLGPNRTFVQACALAFAVAALVFAIVFWRAAAIREKLARPLRTWGRWTWAVIGVLLWVVPSLAFYNSPVHLPQQLGTIPILALFFLVLAATTAIMTRFRDLTHVPVLGVFVTVALLWASTGSNDNHRVRTIVNDEHRSVTRTKDLTTAFYEWQDARKDAIKAYADKGKRFPVYFVAAEGGGMYAAQHTAAFLARIQDACPDFARHIFMISGVSGGSVGASVFTGLQKTFETKAPSETCNAGDGKPGPLEQRVREIFAHDLLSPLAAAALFPDFLQRFLPLPIERFDRARALEFAFEDAWADTVKENPGWLAQSYFGTWSAEGNTPALVFNTTRVETGQRVVIAPFHTIENASQMGHIRDIRLSLEKGEGLATSTIAMLSARFSWVTPAGWLPSVTASHLRSQRPGGGLTEASIKRLTGRKLRIVDGGYFENSGVETAEDMRAVVKERYPDLPLDMRLLIIASHPAVAETGQGFSELLSPFRGLNAARMQRGQMAQMRATSGDCGARHSVNGVPQSLQNCLGFGAYVPPLGWVLSPASRSWINSEIGSPDGCKDLDTKANSDDVDGFLSMAQQNKYVACHLVRQLSPN